MSGWLGGLLGAAGQLGGAYLASNANRQAANTQSASLDRAAQIQAQAQQQAAQLQANSTNQALQLQADIYNQNRADLQPWRDVGSAALQNLAGQVGQWGPGTPAYDFQFSEGMRALDNSASARGMVQSGAAMKAAERFGQGLAAQGRSEELNRLQALAGVGQTATGQGTALAQNYGTTASGLTAGLGQNLAAGQTGLGASLANIYGQQGTAAANGITGAAQPWQNAANNIWALAAKGW